MTSSELVSLWNDWTRRAETLLRALEKQEAALIARETEKVEECLEEVQRLSEATRQRHEEARQALQSLAQALRCTPTLADVARSLPPAEAQVVSRLAIRVEELGDALRTASIRNHALIENELAYLSGTLMLIGETLRQPSTPYGKALTGAMTLDKKV